MANDRNEGERGSEYATMRRSTTRRHGIIEIDSAGLGAFVFLAAGVLLAAGCGGQDSPPPPSAANAGPDVEPSMPSASIGEETNEADWGEINLFQMFDVGENTSRGAAVVSGEGLRFTNPAGACQVYFPRFEPPEEYDLEADVIRTEGDGSIIFGLYAWGQQCRVVIDGQTDSGPRTGLAPIHGKWLNEPGYPGGLDGPVLETGRQSTIVCRVRRHGLVVTCDGRTIVDFRERPSELGKLKFYGIPAPKALSVASWKSRVHIPRMVARAEQASKPISPAEASEPAAAKPTEPAASGEVNVETPAKDETSAIPERLPLEPESWAFAFRHVRSVRRAIVDPRATIEMDAPGLRGLIKAPGLSMQLVYRPRLAGDFQGRLQILVPPRNDPDSYQPGGSPVPYVSFRPLSANGREVTVSIPSASSEPRPHEIAFDRQGSNLSLSLDGKPQNTQQVLPDEEYHLCVRINGPGKVFVLGHEIRGTIGPADFAKPAFTPVDLSPASWVLSRPGSKPLDPQTASLQSADDGLRIDNAVNQPLQIQFKRPLRGDFHLLALVDVVTRSLESRTQGSLVHTHLSCGFLEVGQPNMSKFPVTRRLEESVVRVDLLRERGQIVALSGGRGSSSQNNAADGFVGFQLQRAGTILLRQMLLEADAVLDAPADLLASDSAAPVENSSSTSEPPGPTKEAPPTSNGSSDMPIAVAGEPRTWTSVDGKYRVEATLLEIQGDSVRLRRADGQEMTVPLTRLSEDDRAYVARSR